MDASKALTNNNYKLYKINNTPLINLMTNDNFNALYDKLPTFKLKYYMIMTCLISKNLCHFIVNNKYILDVIMSDNPSGINRTPIVQNIPLNTQVSGVK